MKAMSKQQLADAAGVSVTTLMNWCKAYRHELDVQARPRTRLKTAPSLDAVKEYADLQPK